MVSSSLVRIAAFAGGMFVLVACGGGAQATADAVIESELADQIGLGALDADCDEPDSREVGTTFACTATTEAGDLIQLTTTFEEEDRIFVLPTNVMLAEEMSLVEQEAAQLLSPEVGVTIDPSDVDCPDSSVVLDENGQFRCTITQASTGDEFTLLVTYGDFVRNEGFQERNYEIVE